MRIVSWRTIVGPIASLLAIAGAMGACSSDPVAPPAPPGAPQNVTVTLTGPTSARIAWTPNAPGDNIATYTVYRNTTRLGDTPATSYNDNGLRELESYSYSVTATSASGLTSARSSESPSTSITAPDATPPSISSVTPANGATNIERAATIAVVFSEPMDAATLNATTITLRAGVTAIAAQVNYMPATRTAEVKSSSPLPNSAVITATVGKGVKDPAGNSPASDFTWTFTTRDEVAPGVQSTSPVDGAIGVAVSAIVSVTFTKPMNAATIDGSTFILRATTTGSNVAGVVRYDGSTNAATFTPSASLGNGVSYTATLTTGARDAAGNALAAAKTWTFTTEEPSAALAVTATSPSNGAANVPVTSTISATFGKALDASTISGASFAVTITSTGAAVSGARSYDAATHTVTFVPSAGLLANGMGYTVIISTGLHDTSGSGMASPYVFTFSTIPDQTPPAVTSVSPSNGAAGVALSSTVSVVFSKAMNASTLTSGAFMVSQGGTQLSGATSYDAATRTATFTPGAALQNGTTYTVTVTTSATDTNGIPLSAAFNSTFTTVTAAGPSGLNLTGYWSGTDDGGSIHWHLTLTQSGTAVSLSATCIPDECRVYPLDPVGNAAVGTGIPVDISSVSGTYNDPSVSFTVTLSNGRAFTFTGTVSPSKTMTGTISGATLSARTLTLVKQ